MKLTKNNLIIILGMIVVAGFVTIITLKAQEPMSEENLARYFENRLIDLGVEDIGQPIEGFDSNLLILAFRGLQNEDFENVEALEGEYRIASGTLEFIRNASSPVSSAERTLSSSGYATLLKNLSARLNLTPTSTAAIDSLIASLDTTERVEVRLNETEESLGIKITPLEVVEDSRCPMDVACIWAGRIRLRLRIESGLGSSESVIVLNESLATEAEKITLLNVSPETKTSGPISSEDYLFQFEIEKRS